MSRARVSAARPADRRRSTSGRVASRTATAARVDPRWSRRLGERKSSSRSGRLHPAQPTRRSSTACPARHSGMRGRSRSKRSVNSTSAVMTTVMPMTPADQGDDGRAQRRPVRRGRELPAVHDQEPETRRENSEPPTSPPRARCRTTLMARAHTAMTNARRWPRRTPRAKARSPMPTRATSAPGGLAGDVGKQLEHQMESTPQRRGDGREQVDDPGHGDGARRPPPHPARPVADHAEIGRRWPRRAVGVGRHHHGVGVVHLAVTRRRRARAASPRGAPTG